MPIILTADHPLITKTHESDAVRELMGRAAVRYAQLIKSPDQAEIAGIYKELQATYEFALPAALRRSPPRADNGARKGMRVMVERAQNHAINSAGATYRRGGASRLHFSEEPEPAQPIRTAPDVLRALGDLAHWTSYCVIDHLLLITHVAETSKQASAEERASRRTRINERMRTLYETAAGLAAPSELLTRHLLDAGELPDDAPARGALETLSAHVRDAVRYADNVGESADIKPDEPRLSEHLTMSGPSDGCATAQMGRLAIAYADGMNAIAGRKRDRDAFNASLGHAADLARSLGAGPTGLHDSQPRMPMKTCNGADTPVAPDLAARALMTELKRRGTIRLGHVGDQSAQGLLIQTAAPRADDLGDLGELAAEYIAFICAARGNGVRALIDPERAVVRRERAYAALQRLTRRADETHTPESDPACRAANLIAAEIKLEWRAMTKKISARDRRATA